MGKSIRRKSINVLPEEYKKVALKLWMWNPFFNVFDDGDMEERGGTANLHNELGVVMVVVEEAVGVDGWVGGWQP